MKIVQVTPRYPPHTGGVETHVKEISERLVERGHEVVVLTADAGSDVPHREMRNGVRVKRFRSIAPNGAFHIALQIAFAVQSERADVAHAHNYHSLPSFFAAVAKNESRFVFTPHYHGGSSSGTRDALLHLYRPLGRWAMKRADEVVAVSRWEATQLRDHFSVTPTIIPNGFNLDRFKGAEPELRDRPYVLYVGRLERYKGVQHVIRALRELGNYNLVIAGSGRYRPELEEIARREGVADRVDFLGYVRDERLPGLYAGASTYVSLSEFEAYGLTVAEALASGTPCVVRSAGALMDWVNDSGVIGIETPTPEAVCEAVVAASKQQPGTGSVLDWDEVVDRIEEIYHVA